MIFTLKSDFSDGEVILPQKKNLDVFCNFFVTNAITVPEQELYFSLRASLRIGKEVLIIEDSVFKIPELNFSSRWEVSDNWLWLAPRCLSVLSETWPDISPTLIAIKSSLRTRK